MGREARRRGTFEERKAAAIAKKESEQAAQKTTELNTLQRRNAPGVAIIGHRASDMTVLDLVAAASGLGVIIVDDSDFRRIK